MSHVTLPQIVLLAVLALLGHSMAAIWYVAHRWRWAVTSRPVFSVAIRPAQIRRELLSSWHAPVHALVLAVALLSGHFRSTTVFAFVTTLLLTAAWAEVWHYMSHRAFHLPRLHWIHREHHRSHVNSWLTAISFSFTEKFIFDLGLIIPLALIDHWLPLSFYGIAAWYIGYLVINSVSHANFEWKTASYLGKAGRVLTTTTYHALHHARYTGNYGLGTRLLDRLFGTEWSDYERVYRRVVERQQPLTKLSERE